MNNSNDIAKGILKAVAILCGIALFLYFLYIIESLIVHIIIALIVSLIAHPMIHLLMRKFKMRKIIAITISMLILIGLLAGIITLFIPLITAQSKNLSLLNVTSLEGNLTNLYNEINLYMKTNNIKSFENMTSKFFEYINGVIPNIFDSVFQMIKNIGVGIFSVLFISFFFMKDDKLFVRIITTPFKDNSQNKIKKSLVKIKYLLSRYFLGLFVQVSIIFTIYTIILSIFGIENSIVIAFLCALFNLVPFIGPVIAGILMVVLSMTSNLQYDFNDVILPKSIYIFIGFVITQLLDAMITQPMIYSSSVKSHPLEIFIVIIISGLTFGVLGMIVAIPTYTCIKVIAKEFLSDNSIVQSLTKDY